MRTGCLCTVAPSPHPRFLLSVLSQQSHRLLAAHCIHEERRSNPRLAGAPATQRIAHSRAECIEEKQYGDCLLSKPALEPLPPLPMATPLIAMQRTRGGIAAPMAWLRAPPPTQCALLGAVGDSSSGGCRFTIARLASTASSGGVPCPLHLAFERSYRLTAMGMATVGGPTATMQLIGESLGPNAKFCQQAPPGAVVGAVTSVQLA